MSLHLDPARPAPEEVRSAGVAYLTKATRAITSAKDDHELGEGIHTARKQLKRARALLRLVRTSFEKTTYRHEIARCRDVGRLLSGPRDADVVAATAQRILEETPGPVPADAARIVLELGRERDGAWNDLLTDPTVIEDATGSLEDLAERAAGWTLADLDWATMGRGLARSYRRGRRAFKHARRDGNAEAFHETRKRTKDLWYQFDLVRDAWKPVLKGAAKGAEAVADRLGEIQDLVVVRSTLLEDPESPNGARVLLEGIDRRLDRMRAEALVAGGALYAEKPGAFEKRMLAYVTRVDARPSLMAASAA
jgi:CHAD domain-containing protein